MATIFLKTPQTPCSFFFIIPVEESCQSEDVFFFLLKSSVQVTQLGRKFSDFGWHDPLYAKQSPSSVFAILDMYVLSTSAHSVLIAFKRVLRDECWGRGMILAGC